MMDGLIVESMARVWGPKPSPNPSTPSALPLKMGFVSFSTQSRTVSGKEVSFLTVRRRGPRSTLMEWHFVPNQGDQRLTCSVGEQMTINRWDELKVVTNKVWGLKYTVVIFQEANSLQLSLRLALASVQGNTAFSKILKCSFRSRLHYVSSCPCLLDALLWGYWLQRLVPCTGWKHCPWQMLHRKFWRLWPEFH